MALKLMSSHAVGWVAGGVPGCHGKAPGKVMVACGVTGPSIVPVSSFSLPFCIIGL